MNEFSTIDCSEEATTYAESMSLEGWQVQVQLRCAWSDRYNLVNDMWGKVWPDAPATFINPPRAVQFSIEGGEQELVIPADSQRLPYKSALVTANFITVQETSGVNSSIADYYSESVVPSFEVQKMPHEMFRWSDGRPVEPNEAAGFQLSRETFKRTYYGVTLPLDVKFFNLMGDINDGPVTFPILGFTYQKHEILYASRNINYSLKSDGSQAATLEMLFKHRQEGWRKHWNFESQSFEELELYNGTPVNFPIESDLSVLV